MAVAPLCDLTRGPGCLPRSDPRPMARDGSQLFLGEMVCTMHYTYIYIIIHVYIYIYILCIHLQIYVCSVCIYIYTYIYIYNTYCMKPRRMWLGWVIFLEVVIGSSVRVQEFVGCTSCKFVCCPWCLPGSKIIERF